MDYDQSDVATTYDAARALTPARRRRWQRLPSAHVDGTAISLIVDLGGLTQRRATAGLCDGTEDRVPARTRTETERIMFPYRFRLMTDADLPTVERWLKGPEVVRWWGDPAEQLALLKEDLEEPLMRQWVVERRERPFAYVQAYEAHTWPQFHLQRLPGGAQVLDAFVGEPDMVGRGHGSAFLRLLASMLIRGGAPLVAIDPDVENLRARRAFARAGFAEDAVVQAEQGPVALTVFGGDA